MWVLPESAVGYHSGLSLPVNVGVQNPGHAVIVRNSTLAEQLVAARRSRNPQAKRFQERSSLNSAALGPPNFTSSGRKTSGQSQGKL